MESAACPRLRHPQEWGLAFNSIRRAEDVSATQLSRMETPIRNPKVRSTRYTSYCQSSTSTLLGAELPSNVRAIERPPRCTECQYSFLLLLLSLRSEFVIVPAKALCPRGGTAVQMTRRNHASSCNHPALPSGGKSGPAARERCMSCHRPR